MAMSSQSQVGALRHLTYLWAEEMLYISLSVIDTCPYGRDLLPIPVIGHCTVFCWLLLLFLLQFYYFVFLSVVLYLFHSFPGLDGDVGPYLNI